MTTPITKEQLTDEQIALWLADSKSVMQDGYVFSEEYAAARAIFELASEVKERRKAAMDAEPLRYLNKFSGACVTLDQQPNASDDIAVYLPLFATPPATVVPDEMEPTVEAIKRVLPTSNPDEYAACIGADMWNACRAAMLQADNSPVIPGGWKQWVSDVIDYLENGLEADGELEAQGSIDAKRLLAAAPQQEVK